MTAASKRKKITAIHRHMIEEWLCTAIIQNDRDAWDTAPNQAWREERLLVWLDECLAYWREQ